MPLEKIEYDETEALPENLKLCLAQLKNDFEKGIILLSEDQSIWKDKYDRRLQADKTADAVWEDIEERLLDNEQYLLKKAAAMIGEGQLIGVFEDGKICIKDRGNVPKIYPAKTDNKDKSTQYQYIRQLVHEEGYQLIPYPGYDGVPTGLIAAIETVTKEPVINSKAHFTSILECGPDPQPHKHILVYAHHQNRSGIYPSDNSQAYPYEGAIRILIG